MTELDKKIQQKNQTDLVQSVLEAMEKRNQERVDMLISNAFKQLKMSRFKPDQTVCVSLTYLARICPKAFSQSSSLKDLLQTHIKRDSGPTNIKGTKNDYILPVLAANILLASCDSADIRSVIVTRIEQWISANPKLNELVQHLLATLCIRCTGDPITIKILVEHRNHWYQFLDTNFDIYGQASIDLCRSIRHLIGNELTCESLIDDLSFLGRHDPNIFKLAASISKLIARRPVTVEGMLNHPEHGEQLQKMFMTLYNKLFEHFVTSKIEKTEGSKSPVYIRISPAHPVAIEKSTIEAVLTLLSWKKMLPYLETTEPLIVWLRHQLTLPNPIVFTDSSMTVPYEFAWNLIQRMLHSSDLLRSLAVKCATLMQLVDMTVQFGLDAGTLKMIFARLQDADQSSIDLSRIKNLSYISELMLYYQEMHVEEAAYLGLAKHMEKECRNIEQKIETKIKSEPI